MPGVPDGLRRLDRQSGLTHRPATTIADALAVSDAGSIFARAVECPYRARAAGGTRIQGRAAVAADCQARPLCAARPGAPRLIATFLAAGGERHKRIAAAFDWQGVVLPANFRVDAWVIPPLYTGKPPVILPGIHPGENFAQLDRAGFRAGQLDAGRALDRQGRSRRVRLRRRRALKRAGARRPPAPKNIASPSRRPARRPCAAPATM